MRFSGCTCGGGEDEDDEIFLVAGLALGVGDGGDPPMDNGEEGLVSVDCDAAVSTSSRTHDKAAATARFFRSEPE